MKKQRNRIGLYSLAAAFVGLLLVTLQPWIPLDRVVLLGSLSLKRLLVAFFDASLVGALADWFAVTALFKNPLGLKLPHTDILAKNRDSIAEAVPRFLAGFVTEEKIQAELSRVDFGAKVAELLGRQEIRDEIHGFLRERLPALPEETLTSLVGRAFSFLSERVDPSAFVVGFLHWALRERLHETVIVGAAGLLRRAIEGNRSRLASILTSVIKRNAGWQGLFVGRRVVERLLDGIKEELGRIRSEPDHEIRRLLSNAFVSYAARLSGESPDPAGDRARLGEKLRALLADASIQSRCAGLLAEILERLRLDLSRPDSLTLQGMAEVEEELKLRLLGDNGLRLRFNLEVTSLIAAVVKRSRLIEGVSAYLASLLKATDEREFVDRIESAVWNDLQYIRVNGAVVGGMVGVVLSVLSGFLP